MCLIPRQFHYGLLFSFENLDIYVREATSKEGVEFQKFLDNFFLERNIAVERSFGCANYLWYTKYQILNKTPQGVTFKFYNSIFTGLPYEGEIVLGKI